ncbi:hypothetical protein GCM10008927_10210 [Amylibacter ulvae]|uniref:DUF4139 domain-containing protein n=1 Tax=Paramylibacter ulvae TaxID=1651968 RepID=A0ABQ3CXZ6_9RHOB|nr:mucoidy inhibitor MuiA family protein [Amylibacter ulvae]GHA47354.1 hypothetical protein GCM10008927_10210 [Amylibacter ulvae]
MRFLFPLAVTLLGSTSFADDYNPESAVQSVTAYTRGGAITRVADLDMPAGVHTVTLRGNRAWIETNALEFDFAENSGVTLISTALRNDRLEPNVVEETAQYKQRESVLIAAENALADFDLGVANDRAALQSANLRLEFLRSMASGQAGVFPKDGAVTSDQLSAVVTSLGAEVAKASSEIAAANTRIAASERTRVDLVKARDNARQALDAITKPIATDQAEVTLTLRAERPYVGPLQMKYVSHAIAWSPKYNLHVAQEAAAGTLSIDRRATLYQATGEDWANVAVTLSTADLGGELQTTMPWPDIKRLLDPQVMQKSMGSRQLSDKMMAPQEAEVMMAMAEDAPTPNVGERIKGQTIEFELNALVTMISSNNSGAVFEIDTIDIPVDLFAQANAARDEKAFLYAELENETGGNLLAGSAQIYRDGAYMGEGQFPAITAGDSIDLALGPIDGLLIERRTVSRADGDRGIITSSNSLQLRYETKINSLLDYAIDLRIFDNIPVSESEDLVIKEVLSPKPTEREIDGKRGVLRWDFDMQPNATQTLNTGYDMTWPSAKVLQ